MTRIVKVSQKTVTGALMSHKWSNVDDAGQEKLNFCR